MKVDFGKVEKYIKDRGFGFVSRIFAGTSSEEVFFHIKIVKRTCPQLAQALSNYNHSDSLYLWYEFEDSERGPQAVAILDRSQIKQKHPEAAAILTSSIKTSWKNVEISLSATIMRATYDLLSPDEVRQLSSERTALVENKKRRDEEFRKAETIDFNELSNQRKNQERIEREEFFQLVAEISSLGFTHSNQVSKYIVQQQLGYKYRHISGVLHMELNGNAWRFNGGFPPHIYAKLCEKLGLGNQGSRAKPAGFESYNDLNMFQQFSRPNK